ncbi:phage virion morphogenesis protein [Algivirga pacifica]|uniref:Phage virion morphogenesis protein n=1 Tax=Algivirga pacifica TaxID=1162670 RepID=A0ABP9D7U9_9BACT
MDIKGIQGVLNSLNNMDKVARQVPTIVGQTATNFYKERFRHQNWVDTGTEPWKPRKQNTWTKQNNRGKAILVQSGALKRSIRVISKSSKRVVVGSVNIPYAEVHNEGYRGPVKQRVKSFRRKAHTRTLSNGEVRGFLPQQVKAHSRTLHVNIPKRQYMGGSKVLDRRIERMIIHRIIKASK